MRFLGLALLSIGAVIAAVLAFVIPGPDSTDDTATPFPLHTLPGSASVAVLSQPALSTQPSTLGLAAAPSTDVPPPAWVKAGTRLTFHAAAASVAQSSFAWVEDPNGAWQDPTTGTRYRRTDETGEGVATASGDGFSQVDVQAVEGSNVVLSLTLLGIDHDTQTLVPGSLTGAEVPGGMVDGLWVNPSLLAQLQQVHQDGVLVLRGDYPLNGQTYHAISFAVTTPGAYQQYTYDTVTGVLLCSTSSTQGAAAPVTTAGQAPPQGNTELTVTTLVGFRQRNVPGLGATKPSWVGQTPTLSYSGVYDWVNPVDASSGSLQSPMTNDVALGTGGDAWTSYTARSIVASLGSTTDGQGVTGPTGVYWLSQPTLTGLAAMSPGQVFDQDPVTGEQDVFDGIGQDSATGRQLVTIDTRLPGITSRFGYDATSGVLVSYQSQVPSSGTTMQLELQGGP